jgi:capsid protein
MLFIDRAIASISPRWALSRARYREALAAYEAAKPSRVRKNGADNRSGDAVVGLAGVWNRTTTWRKVCWKFS